MGKQEGRQKMRRQQEFWEKMVDSYPLPFDDSSLADTNRIIALVEARGVEVDGAAILDIGCGSGMYSLPLAKRASLVVGLDFSQGMLDRFERERRRHGITNASSIRGVWKEMDPAATGMENSFDIVWASMTPAVRDADDLHRMSRCARKWCVYIGWGKVRRNPLLERVFTAHGLSFGPPPGAAAIQGLLKKQGIEADVDPVRTHWDWRGSEEEAVEQAAGFIEIQSSREPDRTVIREIVGHYSVHGEVVHRTEVEMGVVVWQIV